MTQQILLSAIQLTSEANVERNLTKVSAILDRLTQQVEDVTHLVVLPECCLYFGGTDNDQLNLAKNTTEYDQLRTELANLAKKYKVYLVAGSIPILTTSGEQFNNTSCMFDPDGKQIGQYDKIHLFDVTVSDNTKSYCESRYTQAGDSSTVVSTVFANIGMTVCFDLRFPSLFQQLTQMGAEIITVPSAFTKVTGEAHWQTLLQARAIENQVYIIAAGQEGLHDNGRETWGHSMIINPWGVIEKILEKGDGFISVEYKPEEITRIRKNMPMSSPFNALLNK